MGFSLEGRGRARRTHGRRATLLALAVLVSLASVGCGNRADDANKKAGSTQAAKRSQPASSSAQATNTHTSKTSATPARSQSSVKPVANRTDRPMPKSTASGYRVMLTQRGCVQLEPHWSNLRVGQSLEFDSDMSVPVTVHVSTGVFDRTEFVVRPGAKISTGPARHAGSFTISTEPASCQGIPRGVHGSGPGMTVDATPKR